MRRIICLMLILLSVMTLPAQAIEKTISGKKYIFEIDSSNSGDEVNITLRIVHDGKLLLTHVLLTKGFDHNSVGLELGDYDVTPDKLVLYTYWNRAGDAPVSPYGVRKQFYTVDSAGRLVFQKGEIYIETTRQGWPENKGIEYLFTKARTPEQEKLLAAYVKDVEREYNASFVSGATRTNLLSDVKRRLSAKIKAETATWERDYGQKFGGYKR